MIIHLVAHHDTIAGPPPPLPDTGLDDDPTDPTDSSDPSDTDDTDDTDAADGAGDPQDAGADTTADDAELDPADPDGTPTTADSPFTDLAGLDGRTPPRFPTPLRDMTLTEILTTPRPGHHHTTAPATIRPINIPPAVIIGGPLLPGAIARRAAHGATIVPIIHPGQAPPEPRYTPSTTLADFIRCRDLTCRFPGCTVPATTCDLDHAIAWPYGPTHAANLRCLCRTHHLLKTFWPGWRDRQHPNGTIDWTAPDGRTHTITPGSRLLFPELCTPTAPTTTTEAPTHHTTGLTMPRRTTTRTQNRAYRITHERTLNRIEAEDAANRRATEAVPPF